VANDEYGYAVAGKREEHEEGGDWNHSTQIEFMEHAAIREASAVKPVVVSDGKGQSRHYSGGVQYGMVELRWL
jgi:hypothetical protein